MMDIDVELFKLIKKYDIYQYIPEAKELYKEDICIHYFHEIMDTIPEDKTIALRGGSGEHTDRLLSILSESERRRIKFLIDTNMHLLREDYKVIHPCQIEQYKVDVVIISSYHLKNEFMRELLNINGSFEIIDPYDYFAQHGVICTKEFYSYTKYMYMHQTYLDVNNTLKLYQRVNDDRAQKFYLEKLIAQCVEIRDFINAVYWIKTYISNGWDNRSNYVSFLLELEQLFIRIKQQLSIKKKPNIIINWIDNVNAKEFYNTEFAKKRRQDSYILENAYTVTPWTHFTQNAIFLGATPIDGQTYLPIKFNEKNSRLLSLLKQYGYKFTYIANPGMYQNLFDSTCLMNYHDEFKNVIMGNRAVSECSTRLQWLSLKQQVMTEQPVCHLVHNLTETHPPCLYTNIEVATNRRKTERTKFRLGGLEFIVKEIEWYSEFLNENTYQIFLSDHGDGDFFTRAYERERTNIPFIVKGPGIPVRREQRLYSHIRFARLLEIILSGNIKQMDDIFDRYIVYENLDFYNLAAIKEHISRWLHGYTPIDMANFQVRGIRTEEDLYVIYAAGKELYFRLPDEETNLIADRAWKSRIDELRQLCPKNFVDIEREPLFKDSQMLYDFLSLIPEKQIRW